MLYLITRGKLTSKRSPKQMRKHSIHKVLLLLVGLASLGLLLLSNGSAVAANPTTLNFQGKVTNADGTNVTSATYPFVFRIYNTPTPTTTTPCGSDSACLYEETQASVQVTNGVFQVELGSGCAGGLVASNACTKTAAGGLNFNTNNALYLVLKFNGDAAGFMSNPIHLTSVPYAFYADNAGQLGGIAASGFIQNGTGTQTSSNFHISNIGQADGQLQAPVFDVITSNTTMGIGTTNASVITIGNTTNSTEVFKTKSSLTAFQVQNASSASIVNVDSTNSRVGVDVTYAAMSSPSGLTSTATNGFGFTAGQSYLYEVTALDAFGGETAVSNEPTACAPASSNLQCTLAWTAVSGASGYKIYRTANGGLTTTEKYLTSVQTNSYNDTNAIVLSSLNPPASGTAFVSTNTSNSLLQLSIGGIGTPSGQVYISGIIPKDITNGGVSTFNVPSGIAISGHFAYIVNTNDQDLQIFDVSNPVTPLPVSTVSLGPGVNKVAVQGKYVYVTGNGAFYAIDVSSSNSPSNLTVGGVPIPITSASTFIVQGRYAFIGNSTTNLVVDISVPSSPKVQYKTFGNQDIFLQNNLEYQLSSTNFTVYNFSNPVKPVLVSGSGSFTNLSKLVVQGRFAYVLTTTKLQVFNVSNPGSITDVSAGGVLTAGTPQNIVVQGRYAYVLNSGASNVLQIFDVSNPTIPTDITGGGVATGTTPLSMQVVGRYAYVVSSANNKFQIFDLGGLYTQQIEAGSAELGSLQIDNNGQVAGDFNIQGGSIVGQSLQVGGSINASSGIYVQGSAIVNGGKNQLGAPANLSAGSATSGGSLSGIYKYYITAVDAYGGETTVSSEVTTASLANPNQTQPLSWTFLTGASNYLIYRTAAGGLSGTEKLLSSTTSTSFSDNGSFSLGTASAPTIDTTGQLTVQGSTLFRTTTNTTAAFQVQNSSGTDVLNVDTANSRIGVDVTYAAISAPSSFTVTNPNNGLGNLPVGTYLYEVTAIDAAGGETPVSSEQSGTTVGTNKTLNLNWTAPTGHIVGYRIYRTAAGGGSGTEKFLESVGPTTTSYTNNNIVPALSSAAVPVSSTLAYTATNNSDNMLQVAIGGNGSPTGQLYVSGTKPQYAGRGACGIVSTPSDVVVQGRYAYISDQNGVLICDVTNPASPVAVSALSVSVGNILFVQGKYLYVYTNTNFRIYDITNPASPSIVSTTTNVINSGGATSMYVQGQYAYLVAGTNFKKLTVLDISNPASPRTMGSNSDTNIANAKNITVQGNTAYILDSTNNKLLAFDVSNPAKPTFLGQNSDSNITAPKWVYVQGRYAYITNGTSSGKLLIYDVSNPSSPTFVTSNSDSNLGFPWKVIVQGRYAYITDAVTFKLNVYDVSLPNNPTFVASNADSVMPSFPNGFYIQGRYAYLTDANVSELFVYDLGGTYTQQLEAGGGEFGALQVDSNARIFGDLSLQGGLQVGSNTQISGSLALTGGQYVQGNTILGGGNNILGAPSGTVTVTPTCSVSCTGSYTYGVTAVTSSGGETTMSSTGNTAAGGATLSGTVFNTISWSAVSGASTYKIYRTAVSGGSPSTTGYAGNSSTTSFVDTGFIANGSSAPTIDTTGQLTVLGSALFQNATNSSTAFQIANSFGTTALKADTTSNTVTIANLTVSGTCTGCGTGSGSTLFASYNLGSTAADQTINLDTAKGGGVIIKDNATSVGSAFQIQNSSGSSIFNADTSNNRLSTSALTVTPVADTTSGFKVQDRLGNSIINVSSVAIDNLLVDGNFEASSVNSRWAKFTTASTETTFAQSSTNPKFAAQSLNVVTTAVTGAGSDATVGQGAKYTYQFKPNTTYTFSVYASVTGTTTNNFEIGAHVNASDLSACTGLSLTTTITRFSCTFTTGTITSPSDYIFMRRSNAAIITMFFDGAQLEQSSSATTYNEPSIGLINLVQYGSFENGNANGWAVHGTGTGAAISVSNDYAQYGSSSLKVVTGSTASGVEYRYQFAAKTQYTLSFWTKLDSGTSALNEFTVGHNDNPSILGTTTGDTVCTTSPVITAASAVTTSWTQFSCTFTTGSTINDGSNIFIKQTDTTSSNLYIDGVTMAQASTGITFSPVSPGLDYNNLTNSLTLNNNNSGELQPWKLNSIPIGATSSRGSGQLRWGSTTVVANGYIYDIGGYDGSSATVNTVYYAKLSADGSVQGWTAATNVLPTTIVNTASVVANGYLYAIGGQNASGTGQTNIWYSKLSGDGSPGVWQTNPVPLPSGRGAESVVVANGILYIIGGCNNWPCTTNSIGTIFYGKLSANGSIQGVTTSGALTQATQSLTNPRGQGYAVFANGNIYYMGGQGNTNGTPAAAGPKQDVYYAPIASGGDITTAFSNGTQLPAPRAFPGSVVVNGYVYLLGGCTVLDVSDFCTTGGANNNIWYSSLNGDGTIGAWYTAANLLPVNRAAMATVVSNSYIYVLGGKDATATYSTVYYTSTARTLISGALDLVGLNSQELDSFGGGGSLTAGNTKVVGTLTVDGYADFNNGISVDSALNINAITGSLGQSIFNINNSSSNSIFSVQDMGINFGSLARGGAFEGKNSYWGEEFNNSHLTACNTTAALSAGTVNAYARGDTGGNLNSAVACASTATTTVNAGELNVADVIGTATIAQNQCLISSQNAANGLERISAAVTINAAGSKAACAENLAANQTTSNKILTTTNLPVMTAKIRATAGFNASVTGSVLVVGANIRDNPGTDGAGANLPNTGVFFSNCGGYTAGAPSFCGNTNLWGYVTSGNAVVGTPVVCTVPASGTFSTTNFMYLRIEVRATNDIHFFVDFNTADGTNEQECGSGVSGASSTAAMTPWLEVKSVGAVNQTNTLDVDYIREWQDDNIPVPDQVLPADGNDSSTAQQSLVTAPISPDSADPQVAGSFFNFNANTSDDAVFNKNVYIHGTLYADKIKANEIDGLNVFTDQLASLQQKLANDQASVGSAANPNTNISNNLSIQTATTMLNLNDGLTVGGDSSFHGNAFFYKLVTFSEKTFFNNDVTFGGHIGTSGITPKADVGASAGLTIAPTNDSSVNLASINISGNDNSGQLNIIAGDNALSGELAVITFTKSYDKVPQVFLAATNSQSALLRYYISATKYGFKIIGVDSPAPGSSYNYNFWVAQ